ncbi:coiled-coil and C2 domain-containing protein 2A-like isoform X2 [Limulus polyphemus]|uniref:Coiled-coil and C2 domain-containing protein 2A-like isoform X2 n=1 Tax=Limulus polyphemus TaxID=6850 RepID=A0ABM1SP20_LIMPO|nr:coiled-coil and C2 domain-containing protein 2A-like isoform X2 [Limulus polyphemus]
MDTVGKLREKIRERRAIQQLLLSEESQHDGLDGIAAKSDSRTHTSWVEEEQSTVIQDISETIAEVTNEDMKGSSKTNLEDLQAKRQKRQKDVKKAFSDATEEIGSQLEKVRQRLEAEENSDDIVEAHKVVNKAGRAEGSIQDEANITPSQENIAAASVRERLRSRLQQAREKGERKMKSDSRTASTFRHRLQNRRFSSPVLEEDEREREEELIKAALDQKAERRNKWSSISTRAMQQASTSNIPSVDEAYDFFTRAWSPEPQPLPKGHESHEVKQEPSCSSAAPHLLPSSQENENDNCIVNIEDGTELLGGDYLISDEDWYTYERVKPLYTSFHLRMEFERQMLFYPETKRVPVQEKIGNSREPRYLEEEGFYVGKRPAVPERNKNKLENRLIRQKEKHWFGDDAQIVALADPLQTCISRPVSFEDSDQVIKTVFVKAEYPNTQLQRCSDRRYQLDVDVSSLTFHHHPLFSKEHVLASKLQELYEEYCFQIENNKLTQLTQRLKTLRIAVANLGGFKSPGEESSSAVDDRNLRLQHYKEELRQTCKARDRAEMNERNLLRSIISLWKEIKRLRELQGYINTALKLTIHREQTNKAEEEEQWEREMHQELEEEKEDFELEYQYLFEQYEKELRKWKKWHIAKKQALRRERKRQSILRQESESPQASPRQMPEDLEQTESEDQKILEEEEPIKPVPPPEFNEEESLKNIRQKALQIRRQPGEPKLYLDLSLDTPITPHHQCPREERHRRNDVSRRKLMIKLVFNEKEVCTTVERPLSQEFTVVWGQIFNLQISKWSGSLRLELYESSSYSNFHMANIYLAIPELSQTSRTAKLHKHQFSSEHVVNYRHAGIGSGIQFHYNNKETVSHWLLTNGVVRCSVSWGVGEDGEVLAPSSKKEPSILSTVKQTKASHYFPDQGHLSDVEKLREWAQHSHLDPNDPCNAGVFEAIRKLDLQRSTDGEKQGSSYFRLESLMEEFEFASSKALEDNPRFRLLKLRAKEVPEFRNYQMVPVNEKEISKATLEQLWQMKKASESRKPRDEIEAHRVKSLNYLNKVREQVMKKFQAIQRQITLEDIVSEDQVPNIGSIGLKLFCLDKRTRPLHMKRKERKKVTVIQTSSNMDHESQVRPFVEVLFQKEIVRTYVSDGPQPTWNQELELSLRAPNEDYSPSSLETIQDTIYFSLFDEVIVDMLEDETERDIVVHQRLERRWLGSLKIPFSTLYFNNSKIDGTFHVLTPPVLLGYGHEPKPWLSSGVFTDINTNNTYLSVFITIEPALQLPETFREKCESSEPGVLLQEAHTWQSGLQEQFPQRFLKTMAVDINGKWVFIPRYLRPLKPPQELLDLGSNDREKCEVLARFVSLIPTVSDSVIFPGMCDIWNTCDQFLDMLTGDEEEHAILLCNFFLYLNKRVFLLLGSGIPEGHTAYVLTVETDREILVWNATQGQHFSVRESFSPLQRVGCLISPDNIWANIQKDDHPSRISFEINQARDWQPFFTRRFPNPGLSSVQPEVLVYTPTDPRFVRQLQEKIETYIKESIMRWRRKYRTSWNRHCIQMLQKILPKLEINFNKTASIDSSEELKDILGSFKVCGFPLSMPYTEIENVVEAVFATGVHQIEDKDVEFALAVHIHPYPCTVLAVWVYLAVLKRR